MMSVRLHEVLLSELDEERKPLGLSRAKVIHQALEQWLARRRYDAAVAKEQQAYDDAPVQEGEFDAVLGAQVWPA